MKKLLCAAALVLAAGGLNALEMDSDHSELSIVSVKNDRFAEVFTFKDIKGHIADDSGKAVIQIALDSIDTGVAIRDERMQKYLFETDKFKTAEFTSMVDLQALKDLGKGEQRELELKGELALHGNTVPMRFATQVTRLSSGELQIVTLKPSFIDVTRHELAPGIGKLRSLAGLNGITLVVPVTFSVVFK
jgi:polyisoprenoid-binding protein YceI